MLGIDEIKDIQLSILKDVHTFCMENGIDYSLAHGTLLGAVRHKGFIPWDDDIDICLLEKDYERFMNSFSHPYLKALSLEKDYNWPYPYGKVYDSRTVIREDADITYDLGVNIDVFPIYHYPDNAFRAMILRLRLFVLSWIHNIKLIRLSKKRGILKNVVLSILKVLCLPFSFLSVNSRIRKLCLEVNQTPSSRLFETRTSQTVVYDADMFESFELMDFENNKFCAMKGWHGYLSRRNGDYMILPPKNKQVSHHNITAIWKNEA